MSEVHVGKTDPFHILAVEFIEFRVGTGVAPLPEGMDEFIAFGIVFKLPKDVAFRLGDNGVHQLQPFLVIPGLRLLGKSRRSR